jgi:hypothetical protein
MSEPVGALGRDGAAQAAAEFTALSLLLDPEVVPPEVVPPEVGLPAVGSPWGQAATVASTGEI